MELTWLASSLLTMSGKLQFAIDTYGEHIVTLILLTGSLELPRMLNFSSTKYSLT